MTNINFGIQSGFVLGTKNNQKRAQTKTQDKNKQIFSNNQTFKFTSNPTNNNLTASQSTNEFGFSSITKEMKLKNMDKYFKEDTISPKTNCFNIIGLFTPGEFLQNAMEKDNGKTEKRFSIQA